MTSLAPRIYCTILLIFLFPLFMLITFQLVQIINIEAQFNKLSQKDLAGDLDNDDAFVLAQVYVKKKLWLSSIRLLESKSIENLDSRSKYFNMVGFSYYSMKQYKLAKVYYLRALKLRKDYLIALQNLAKIYELTKEFSLALQTYNAVLFYYPDNSLAVKSIERIRNRDSRI
uniref:Uncharacterized protein n=1 Tax=Lithothamnion sp. TaxID=1940749 RepID=A0A3G3MGK5_9FLOR|nr:hypothetical protein [Lithothamnion sp.]